MTTFSEKRYTELAPLREYIDRIGAEELNFRTFIRREYRGHYYEEKTIIKIGVDGKVTCKDKNFLPTSEEAKRIEAAVLAVQDVWPTCQRVTRARARELLRSFASDSIGYEYLALEGDEVIMVQERRQLEDGKAYIPWSFWAAPGKAGKWLMMEPDGPLPFWKPSAKNRRKDTSRIMIHEGGKAASYITELVKDKADHPWYDELAGFEHWGIQGGALAPGRTDYKELHRRNPSEVVYVCDNDYFGIEAVKGVSEHYGGVLKSVQFDNKFPPSWDLADPMPEALFKKGRYVGPTMASMYKPATWATDKINTGGRPGFVIRKEFAEGWHHSVKPLIFFHIDRPSKLYTPEEFNTTVRPFSHAEDTDKFLKKIEATKSPILAYNPSHAAGFYSAGRGRYFNTHVPSSVVALRGDPRPWTDFMEYMIPDPFDRTETYRWIATLIAKPEVRMLYGVLMISETQGVGKSTLGARILLPLVGEENTSEPSEHEIVESQYNYWAHHKRLVVVHEIYAGNSTKAYNRLKDTITERHINIMKKYIDVYQIDNWIHIFACSNSNRALKLAMEDRRWFVPRITEEKRPTKYWTDFNTWLDDGGLGIIKYWADEWLKHNDHVLTGTDAPRTTKKDDVIHEGFSDGMNLVEEVLDRIKTACDPDSVEEIVLREDLVKSGMMQIIRGGKVVQSTWPLALEAEDRLACIILDTSLGEMIQNEIHDGKRSEFQERPSTIRKVAKEAGWFINTSQVLFRDTDWRRKAHVIVSSPELARVPLTEFRDAGKTKFRPIDWHKVQKL